ncbi:MAG: PEP-utilizing enzyme [bacterium]|nr:PEP-utilizing enzyme [bacterium]
MIDQEKLLPKMKDFKWLLSYEEPANVFSILMATHSRTKFIKESIGETLTATFCEITNKMFKFYTDPAEDEKISEHILEKILSDKGFFPLVEKMVDKRSATLLVFARSLQTMNFGLKSDKELLDLYDTFIEKFISMRNYSSIPTIIELTNTFTKHLKSLLEKYPIEDETREEVFSTLTSPDKLSYVSRHDLEISHLALDYLNADKRWKSLAEKIRLHEEKWTWLDYTFDGVPITVKGFKTRIIEKSKDKLKLEKTIRNYEETEKLIKQKKLQIIERYKISEDDQKFFHHGAGMVWIKFFRKGTFAESYYCVEFLFSEMARRKHVSLEMLKNMFEWEVRDLLSGKAINKKEISKRIEHGYILDYQGDVVQVTDDNLLGSILDNIVEEKIGGEDSVRGQVAFAGTAEGVVKIVNDTPDMAKMEEGDILVSRSTNPKLFPAMKKAAAFVTDMGGLTCHAAIVARELGVPCVVGTKQATKILKDGDRVEVDAVHGLVKIIKRS